MNKITTHRNSDYLTLNRTALKDERLSWGAKGLHAYLMSLPDTWEIYEEEINTHAKNGKTSFKSLMKELIDCGYMNRSRKRNEKGQLKNYEYDLYEIPIEKPKSDFPTLGKPTQGNPTLEKPTLENKSILSIDGSKYLKKEVLKEVSIDIYTLVVEYLNQTCGLQYKPSSKKTQSLIKSRMNEGFTLDDFKKVIDNKHATWSGTDMEQYLRPETLFGTKFEGYLNEKPVKKGTPKKNERYIKDEHEYRELF